MLPNPVIPNSVHFLTRRTINGHFFLKPDSETCHIFRFLLAALAERYSILVHHFVIMANHYHLIVTDQGININRFNQDFNALLAKCMNAKLKRKGTFWAPGDVGDTRLITPQDIIEKAIYSLANPVSAGIIKRAHQDCSRISRIGDIGAPGDALKRPRFYFKTNSEMQKDATLRLCVPNAFSDSPKDYRQNLWERLFERENEIAAERGPMGFMGKRKAMKISAFDRPREDLANHTLNPRIACCDPKLMSKEKKALRAFRKAYREARAAWLQGNRSVLFPPGTWAMMFFHGAKTMTFKEDILIL